MSFSNAQAFAGLRATATPDAPQTRNNNEVGFAPFTANLTDAESVYSVRATLADGDVLILDMLTGDAGESVINAIPDILTITGITDPADSDPIIVTRGSDDIDGFATWSGDDTEVLYGGILWSIRINAGVDYLAEKVSADTSPVGLTSWTVDPGSGQPSVAGSFNTPKIIGGDGNDIYGDPLPTIDTIQGVMIKCISGAADIEINGNELKSVTAGDVRLAFNAAGMPSYADDLEATATAANTVLEIVVIGKNA
jgi:hypothetical protein